MIDVILVLIIAVLLAAAVIYIIKAKKKGVKCIGCPAAGSCQAERHNHHAPKAASCCRNHGHNLNCMESGCSDNDDKACHAALMCGECTDKEGHIRYHSHR